MKSKIYKWFKINNSFSLIVLTIFSNRKISKEIIFNKNNLIINKFIIKNSKLIKKIHNKVKNNY